MAKRKSKIKLSEEDKIEGKLLKKGAKLEDSIIGKINKYLHLHLDNYETSHGRRIEGSLFLLNFIAIVLFVIGTHNLSGSVRYVVETIEFFVVLVFVVEYAVRMWVAKKKIKHFFNGYSIIDLLSILPILVHFADLGFLRIFRILRLFRMLRILRFQRIFKAKDTLFGKLTDTQLIIIRIVLTVFTIIFVSSGLIWAVESKINVDYGTIWNAMYFSVVTLSTVGYGDVTPLSPLGKVITIAMILSGIAFIPWQLGKLIKILFLSTTKKQVKCKKCGLADHDADSKFCKICGKALKKIKMMEEETF